MTETKNVHSWSHLPTHFRSDRSCAQSFILSWRFGICYDQLQFSSIHRSLPVTMSSIFVNVLFTKVECLRIKGVATSQRQRLVASPSTFPHDAQCLLRIESPGMTVGMRSSRLYSLETDCVYGKHFNIRGVTVWLAPHLYGCYSSLIINIPLSLHIINNQHAKPILMVISTKTIECVSDTSGNGWADDVTLNSIHARSLFTLRFHSLKEHDS